MQWEWCQLGRVAVRVRGIICKTLSYNTCLVKESCYCINVIKSEGKLMVEQFKFLNPDPSKDHLLFHNCILSSSCMLWEGGIEFRECESRPRFLASWFSIALVICPSRNVIVNCVFFSAFSPTLLSSRQIKEDLNMVSLPSGVWGIQRAGCQFWSINSTRTRALSRIIIAKGGVHWIFVD